MMDPERARIGGLRALVAVAGSERRGRCLELLKGAGLPAEAVADGIDLLEAIGRQPPDLLVHDAERIGSDLADRVRDDFAIRHVKLISLEAGDLEQPPEQPGQRFVDRVLDAVEPRLALEAGLDGGEGVSGRVEEVGARVILEAIARRRRDRRLTVWIEHVTLVAEFRGGELYTLEFTDLHGDPCSGPAALEKLLALDGAVFEVAPSTEDPNRQFQRSVSAEVEAACERLSGRAPAAEMASIGRGAIASSGGGKRSTGLRAAVTAVVLLVLGAGIFLGIRQFVFGGAGEDDLGALGPAGRPGGEDDAGAAVAVEVSEAELEQLEAALRRGAVSVKPSVDADGAVELTAPAEVDAGSTGGPADEDRAPEPQRPPSRKRPVAKGEQKEPQPPAQRQVKPHKKKGDPDVEAMIDDLGIDFE